MSSLVVIRGRRRERFTNERKREIAESAGISFIKLVYNNHIGTSVGVMGFQNVNVATRRKQGGGKISEVQWSIDLEGNNVSKGQLDFVPDEMDRGYAYLPDSEFNRERLAYALMSKNCQFSVADGKQKIEIDQLIKDIQDSDEYREEIQEADRRKTETRVLAEQESKAGDKSLGIDVELASTLEVWKKKVEEAKTKEEVEKLKAEFNDLADGKKKVLGKNQGQSQSRSQKKN